MSDDFALLYAPGAPVPGDRRDHLAAVGPHAAGDGPLAAAAQRAPGRAGPVTAVLCGAVYNADALGRDLGLAPRSRPEEVLAAGYRRWGRELLGRLRGDFAVLVWDAEARTGLIARDQLGARCLYVHAAGGLLAAATEVAPLLALLPRRPAPDPVAMARWLGAGALPPGRTVYEGVERLAPGSCLELRADGWSRSRYWEPRPRPPAAATGAELAAEARERVVAAIGARCEPGGRTAVLLSGGLDSSSIAAAGRLAVEEPRRVAAAYSGVFPQHPAVDETSWIDGLADHVGLPSVRAVVQPGGLLASAAEYVRRWDVPLMGASWFFERPLLARAGADGMGALLDGEGGDEVFGARYYLLADLVRRGRLGQAVALARRMPGMGPGAPRRQVLAAVCELGGRGAAPHALHALARRRRDPAAYVPAWLTAAAARASFDAADDWSWKRLDGPRWWAYHAYVLSQGIEAVGIFDHVRRRAAGAGLAARQPLLDLDLVEFALALPPESTFDPVHNRPLLRRAMAGLLPEQHRRRTRKSHFDTLIRDGLLADLRVARDLVAGPRARTAAYADRDAVERLLLAGPDAHPRGTAAWADELWRLAALECWLRAQAGEPWDAAGASACRVQVERRPGGRGHDFSRLDHGRDAA